MPGTPRQSRILLVDDLKANIDVLKAALGKLYDLAVAENGASALDMVDSFEPDLILLDIMMPVMDGYEVCRKLKESAGTASIPVIFLSALSEAASKTRGFQAGAVDYITKPLEIREVRERVRIHLELRHAQEQLRMQNDILDEKVRERTQELLLMRDALIESLGSLTEYRDPETGNHILRTSSYINLLASELEDHPGFKAYIARNSPEMLAKVAPLHDIGKVGVPDYILLKPGKLSPEEFELMKKHTIYGYKALTRAEDKSGGSDFLGLAKELVVSHHECFDGSGYPHGLRGEDIPVAGRLMAIADVYDALISPRVYKQPLPHDRAVEIILRGDGRTRPGQFAPVVLSAFECLQDTFDMIARELGDSHEGGSLL